MLSKGLYSMEKSRLIEEKLRNALAPVWLDGINESHLHKGHRGDDGSGESRFKLIVVSSAFEGLGRIQRHKLVHKVIDYTSMNIHALSIEAYSPEEKPSK